MNTKEQVLELHQQGRSIREIANQVGIGKSTVARWIQDHLQSNQEEPTDPSIQLELRKLELQHELELKRLAQQDREQELRQRQMQLDQKANSNQDQEREIELRRVLLPIQKWARHELKLMDKSDENIIHSSLPEMKALKDKLSRFHESLSDFVQIHDLDDWDEYLDILVRLMSKTDEWLYQLNIVFKASQKRSRENWELFKQSKEWQDKKDKARLKREHIQTEDMMLCTYSWSMHEMDMNLLSEIME